MKRIVLVALVVVACGEGSKKKPDAGGVIDSPADTGMEIDAAGNCPLARTVPEELRVALPDHALVRRSLGGIDFAQQSVVPGPAVCNPLTQTGCATGEKCTWLHDAPSVGHTGCSPNGTVNTGGTCVYGADGPLGYDNCLAGNICVSGKCKLICDNQGGSPMCPANFACTNYNFVFANPGEANIAGACDATCDPLADNDFLGSGNKPGSACAAGQGCYGYPRSSAPATKWSCAIELANNKNLVHRTACTSANGCANSGGGVFLNGCAQGYLPLLRDSSGSQQIDCIALCKPGNTFAGNAGCNYPRGVAPHRCNTTDARGVFNTAPGGEHCAYSWLLELDFNGQLVRSATSDTVGFCIDHSKYLYDANNDGTPESPWPACDTLPLAGSGSGLAAGDFGCVDSATAGVMNAPMTIHHGLRLPYSISVQSSMQ